MYWAYMQRRKFKELETEAMVMWGYDPKKSKAKERQKQLAEKWNEDPLFNFPNDIEYLTADQVAQKLSVSRRFWKKMLPEARWTAERAEACLRKYGIVARRCSMNDRLWALYQRAKEKGVELTLEEVKRMILIDIKRSKLYPPGWQDADASPPEWYLNELRQKGLLDLILKEIDEATRVS